MESSPPGSWINHRLDRLAVCELRLGRRRCSTFQVCGVVGLAVALVMGSALAQARGLSPLVMAALFAGALASSLALVFFTKVATGQEQLVYYHHEIVVVLGSALVLRLCDVPVLPHLDIVVLGLGAFLTCGRVGCFAVGCCYGRPHRRGVRYGTAHGEQGFSRAWVGARLLPIQLVESAFVGMVVVTGAAQLLRGAAAGTTLTWYLTLYALGRFCFEVVRGDPGRGWWIGFSQGQWISCGSLIAVVTLERAGRLPVVDWHLAAVATVAAALLVMGVRRRLGAARVFRLFHPRHLHEVAELLGQSSDRSIGVRVLVGVTSQGLQISAGTIPSGSVDLQQVTFTWPSQPMSPDLARRLAELVRDLRAPDGQSQLVERGTGVFHVLLSPPGSERLRDAPLGTREAPWS